MNKITFKGKIWGDGECWCMQVSAEEYKSVVGQENYEIEKDVCELTDDDTFLLYPNDFINKFVTDKNKEVEITVSIKEL